MAIEADNGRVESRHTVYSSRRLVVAETIGGEISGMYIYLLKGTAQVSAYCHRAFANCN